MAAARLEEKELRAFIAEQIALLESEFTVDRSALPSIPGLTDRVLDHVESLLNEHVRKTCAKRFAANRIDHTVTEIMLNYSAEPATATLKRRRAQTYAQEKKAQIEALKAEEIKLRSVVMEYEKTLDLANQVDLDDLGKNLTALEESMQRTREDVDAIADKIANDTVLQRNLKRRRLKLELSAHVNDDQRTLALLHALMDEQKEMADKAQEKKK